MIELEISIRDENGEHTETFAMTEQRASETGDRYLMENVFAAMTDAVLASWRVPGYETPPVFSPLEAE